MLLIDVWNVNAMLMFYYRNALRVKKKECYRWVIIASITDRLKPIHVCCKCIANDIIQKYIKRKKGVISGSEWMQVLLVE